MLGEVWVVGAGDSVRARGGGHLELARRVRRGRSVAGAMTPMATMATMIVATALTLGFRPSRAREKITSGMVVAPGPDRKADSTTSSSDR
jgi:hypothetical protein